MAELERLLVARGHDIDDAPQLIRIQAAGRCERRFQNGLDAVALLREGRIVLVHLLLLCMSLPGRRRECAETSRRARGRLHGPLGGCGSRWLWAVGLEREAHVRVGQGAGRFRPSGCALLYWR